MSKFPVADKAEHWADIMQGNGTVTSPRKSNGSSASIVSNLRSSITARYDDLIEKAQHNLAKASAECDRARDNSELDAKEKAQQAAIDPLADQIYNQEKLISKLQAKVDRLKKAKQKHKDNLEFFQRERKKRADEIAKLTDNVLQCSQNLAEVEESKAKALAEIPELVLGELNKGMQFSLERFYKCDERMPLHLPYQYTPKTETLLLFSPFNKDIYERFSTAKSDDTPADMVTRLFTLWFWTIMAALKVERDDVTPCFVSIDSVGVFLYLRVKLHDETVKGIVERGARLLVAATEKRFERPLQQVEKVEREMGQSFDVPEGVDFNGMFTFSEIDGYVWEEVKAYFI